MGSLSSLIKPVKGGKNHRKRIKKREERKRDIVRQSWPIKLSLDANKQKMRSSYKGEKRLKGKAECRPHSFLTPVLPFPQPPATFLD